MSDVVPLDPVDQVEITTLFENHVDMTIPSGGPIERLPAQAGQKVVSNLLVGERRMPFVGGHGLSPAHCTGYRAAHAVYQARPDAFVQNTVGTRITMKAAQPEESPGQESP